MRSSLQTSLCQVLSGTSSFGRLPCPFLRPVAEPLARLWGANRVLASCDSAHCAPVGERQPNLQSAAFQEPRDETCGFDLIHLKPAISASSDEQILHEFPVAHSPVPSFVPSLDRCGGYCGAGVGYLHQILLTEVLDGQFSDIPTHLPFVLGFSNSNETPVGGGTSDHLFHPVFCRETVIRPLPLLALWPCTLPPQRTARLAH